MRDPLATTGHRYLFHPKQNGIGVLTWCADAESELVLIRNDGRRKGRLQRFF